MRGENPKFQFIAGFIPVIILFLFSIALEGNKIITGPDDIIIPLFSAKQNLLIYFEPIKSANFGSFGNAPWSYLLIWLVSMITSSAIIAQHIISLAPILFSYVTFWLLLGEISNSNRINRILFADLYVFNSVCLDQFIGATGLMYMYAFLPLYLYFFFRYFNKKDGFVKSLIGSLFAQMMATFSSSETILHTIIIALPIIFLGAMQIRNTKNGFLNFGRTIGFYCISIALGVAVFSYMYFPWLEAVIGMNTTTSHSLLLTANKYLNTNFYQVFSGLSTFTMPFSPLFTYAYVNSFSLVALFVALFSLVLIISSIAGYKQYPIAIGSFIFEVLITAYLAIANYYPDYAYYFFMHLRPFTIPLTGFTIQAEWWYILVPWEIILLYVGSAYFSEFVTRVKKFLKSHFNGRFLNGKRDPGDSHSSIVEKFRKRNTVVIPVLIVFLVIGVSSYAQLPEDFKLIDSTSPPTYVNYYGNVSNTNHIPTTFANLLDNLQSWETENSSRSLFFPTYPLVTKWMYTDSNSISFPSGNDVIDTLVQNGLNYAKLNNTLKASKSFSSLGIQFIVIIWSENESKTSPRLINQGLIGNPYEISLNLEHSPYFSQLSNNSFYSLFVNNEFAPVHGYSAAYSIPGNVDIGSRRNVTIPITTNISLPQQVQSMNILNFREITSNKSEWSPSANTSIIVSGSSSSGNISLSRETPGFSLTYDLLNASTNLVPVLPSQQYRLSFVAVTSSNTSGKLYVGWNNRTLSLRDVGDQPISPINLEANRTYNFTQEITIGNIYYIIPLIALYDFSGKVNVLDPQLNLVNQTDTSLGFLNYSKSTQSINWLQTYNQLTNTFPFSNMALVANSTLSNQSYFIPKIRIFYPQNVYCATTSLWGIILPIYTYSIPKYGLMQDSLYGISFHSISQISGSIILPNGEYSALVQGSGNGFLRVYMNGNQFSIRSKGDFFYQLNFSVSKGNLEFNLTNYLGSSNLESIVIFNKNSTKVINSMNKAGSIGLINLTKKGTSLMVDGSISGPEIIAIPQRYFNGWGGYITNGKSIESRSISVFELNGWEIGIYVNATGTFSVNLKFNPGKIFYATLHFQTSMLFAIPLILLVVYIYDFYRSTIKQSKSTQGNIKKK